MDFEGDYYRSRRATIYDRPDEPVPIYVAAGGPLAAKLAGRVGRRLHLHLAARTRSSTSSCWTSPEGAEKAGRDYEQISA